MSTLAGASEGQRAAVTMLILLIICIAGVSTYWYNKKYREGMENVNRIRIAKGIRPLAI